MILTYMYDWGVDNIVVPIIIVGRLIKFIRNIPGKFLFGL